MKHIHTHTHANDVSLPKVSALAVLAVDSVALVPLLLSVEVVESAVVSVAVTPELL